jgi:hypothetical protein
MPHRRPDLLPLAPSAGDDDDSTWMLTFSDLVLLLLAFVALSAAPSRGTGRILPEPGRGTVGAFAVPGVALADTRETAARRAPDGSPPATWPRALRPALMPPPSAARTGGRPTRLAWLRALAERLRSVIEAAGIPGVAPIVVEEGTIVLALGRPASARFDDGDLVGGPRPVTRALDALTTLRPTLGIDVPGVVHAPPAARHAGAADALPPLARAAALVRTLTAGDDSLEVRTVAAGHGTAGRQRSATARDEGRVEVRTRAR